MKRFCHQRSTFAFADLHWGFMEHPAEGGELHPTVYLLSHTRVDHSSLWSSSFCPRMSKSSQIPEEQPPKVSTAAV